MLMKQLQPSQNQTIIDRLASKNRQLFFQLGSQQNEQQRKRLRNQIAFTTEQIRQRLPYQRYQILQKNQIQLSQILAQTQQTLQNLEHQNQLLKQDIQSQTKKKQKLIEGSLIIKKSQELQNKIYGLKKEIEMGTQIGSRVGEYNVDCYVEIVSKMRDDLGAMVDRKEREAKEIEHKAKEMKELLAIQNSRWEQISSKKRRLQNQLHLILAHKLTLQCVPNLLQKSTKSSRAGVSSSPPALSSLRPKKKLLSNQQIMIKKESPPHTYTYIWVLILVIWAAVLFIVGKVKNNGEHDSVCL